MAILAAHLGVIDEQQIDNMSYVFFDDVMAELGHRLNYEAVVNYAGNAFCEKSWDMITKSNPFHMADEKGTGMNGFASFLSGSKITILKKDNGGNGHGEANPDGTDQ